MLATNFRIVEQLDNGDEVITYFEVKTIAGKFFYVYKDVNHGPYNTVEEAVNAAQDDLIDTESL
jgi:uncharacterized RmlC-like cupin family protein